MWYTLTQWRLRKPENNDCLSKRIFDQKACQIDVPVEYMDVALTKLVWEKALKSNSPEVADAIQQLWTVLEQAEKK